MLHYLYSITRKHKDDEHGYLIAMNIGDHISSHDEEISRNIDFSTIWPDIPAKGYLYTMAGPPHNQTLGYHYKREYVISFNFDRSHIR